MWNAHDISFPGQSLFFDFTSIGVANYMYTWREFKTAVNKVIFPLSSSEIQGSWHMSCLSHLDAFWHLETDIIVLITVGHMRV